MPRTFRLTWEDGHDLAGLEVTVRAFTLEEHLLAAATLAFASNLVAWNLEDASGMPVPPTREGLLVQDPALRVALVLAWRQAMAGGAAAPAAEAEDDVEASLPMSPPGG